MKRLFVMILCLTLLSACQSTQPQGLIRPADKPFGATVRKPFDDMVANASQPERIAGCVYFEFNDSELSREARQELDRIARIVSARSGPVIVEGHADTVNTEAFNKRLGFERALMAAHYLENAGVWDERLVIRSFGEDRPAESNLTDRGRALNRRVVVKTFPQGEGMNGKRALVLDKKMAGSGEKKFDLNNSVFGEMLKPLSDDESDGS